MGEIPRYMRIDKKIILTKKDKIRGTIGKNKIYINLKMG
jgi:hypothetical protein